ncbi:MAG: HAD family hydrolase [Candidatus Gribaldobacteria bacterium]|nr:HAD family hydrolase [Candidatus Gribaldobacteria bacterium]
MIKAIIFDCWSTLIKKDAPAPSSIPKKLNWEDDHEVEKKVGRILMLEPIKDLKTQVIQLLEELGIKYNEVLVADVMDILADKYVNYNKFYDGTLEVLSKLKQNYKLGLITNTTDIAFEPLRKKYKFDEIFDEIIASYEVGLIKPDPKIFELALEKLAVKPREALMVGDNPVDDLGGCMRVGIRGLMLDNKNKYPDYPIRISKITEILEWLKNNV